MATTTNEVGEIFPEGFELPRYEVLGSLESLAFGGTGSTHEATPVSDPGPDPEMDDCPGCSFSIGWIDANGVAQLDSTAEDA